MTGKYTVTNKFTMTGIYTLTDKNIMTGGYTITDRYTQYFEIDIL